MTYSHSSTFERLETTFYVVFLPVMSHCSALSDDMRVNNSLLNPPSEVEKMRDLGSNSERGLRGALVAHFHNRLLEPAPAGVAIRMKRTMREAMHANSVVEGCPHRPWI
jgi:hypothetical protein